MRIVLSTFDSRGGVEPMLALALQLREIGADVLLCAPPDCADRAAELDMRLDPIGRSVRELVHATAAPSPADVPRLAHELMGELFEKLTRAARGCDAIVTSGVMSAVAAVRSVAEKLDVPSSLLAFCPIYLPSPHHRPQPLPMRPIPPDVTDPAELDAVDRQNYTSLFGPPLNAHRAVAGLPPATMYETTSSATGSCWPPIPSSPHGCPIPPSTSCRPALGRCRTVAGHCAGDLADARDPPTCGGGRSHPPLRRSGARRRIAGRPVGFHRYVAGMTLEWEQVIVDAVDPASLGRWWAQALGWVVVDDSVEEFEIRESADRLPGMLFVRADGPRTTKNRLHLDFRPEDQSAEVTRLLALGATTVDIGQGEQPWTVLADPEGNVFCVLSARST